MIILQDELNNSTLLKKESVSQIKAIETIQLKLEQKKRMGGGGEEQSLMKCATV